MSPSKLRIWFSWIYISRAESKDEVESLAQSQNFRLSPVSHLASPHGIIVRQELCRLSIALDRVVSANIIPTPSCRYFDQSILTVVQLNVVFFILKLSTHQDC